MSFTPQFETDTSVVRSNSFVVSNKELSNDVATLTTSTNHSFTAGWFVTVTGVGEPFDGTFRVKTVTGSTFSYDLISEDVASTSTTGYAFSPAPTYVRYLSEDIALDAISSLVSFYVEPWDYNSNRIVWGLDPALEVKALDDISNGLEPRVIITRSTFGYPSTTEDGEKIFDKRYADVIASVNRPDVLPYFETQTADVSNDFNRPPLPVQSLYDRNLQSGKWHYYSIFFYLKGDDANPSWRVARSMSALVPINHGHSEVLYSLIPSYYQNKDVEFTPGTGRAGTLRRLTRIIGFELDYTKTLADGIEKAYDVDNTQDKLLKMLGESNFGVPIEGGLGDIRYRSLLATISRLYDERGSIAGLQKVTTAATKYRCKVIEGINLMNLTDDSEFAGGSGSWGDLKGPYNSFLGSQTWMGSTVTTFNVVNLDTVSVAVTPVGGTTGTSLVTRRNALKVSTSGSTGGMIISCGLGAGEKEGRRHETVTDNFYPRSHGIRCTPGVIYTFSAYARIFDDPAVAGTPTAGNVSVGVLWFNDPENNVFSVTNDFISKGESFPVSDSTTVNFKRYSVDAEAPLSLRGQPYVFAVPYIIFSNTSPRYVSACMFNSQLNSAADFAVETDNYLTLGSVSELLGSDFVLGSN